MNIATHQITLETRKQPASNEPVRPFDDNIKQLERRLAIEINRRDNRFKLTGLPMCVTAATNILRHLYVDTAPMRGQISRYRPGTESTLPFRSRVLEQSAESVPDTVSDDIKTKRE
ncbi:hypothetical protein ACNKHP_21060 [Shigella boydii]